MSQCRRPIEGAEVEQWQTFGALLARTRTEAGVTQRQLALVAGFGLRHMQKIEAGERRTRGARLLRMTDFLAVFLAFGDETHEESVARILSSDPDGDDPIEEYSDRLFDALLEVSGVTLPPGSEHEDRPEVQRRERARAQRAWREMTGPDRRKVRQRRPSGEEQRRRARLTLRAAHEAAGFEPWQARIPGM